MADNASSLPKRGKTWFDGTTPPTSYTTTVDVEGRIVNADDIDTSGVGTNLRRSGRQVTLRLVRNTSGITLAPSRVVTWEAGYIGTRVDGYCTSDHQEAAGVVDDAYTTGIPDDDLGWIVVSGPCLVRISLAAAEANAVDAGDTVTALTAASSQATTSGRIQAYAVTSNATLGGLAAMNRVGVAISGATTADTGATKLVDVRILSNV